MSNDDDIPPDDPLEAALEHGIRQDNTYVQIKEAVRQGLSLYTTDCARGTVDSTVLAQAGDQSIVDAPAKKQQKGDFIFR